MGNIDEKFLIAWDFIHHFYMKSGRFMAVIINIILLF